ncbi:MAG: LapA family protein [Gammaproteobacteria bacterium]|nr:LapA family protein [Gammaproteobacteria bacterium]MCH9744212.1 LapA family protein [Gammaproteobacteria bacterium]
MRYIIYTFWILFVALCVSFVVLNSHMVEVNYYVGSTRMYFPLLLLILLVVGSIIGIITMLPVLVRQKTSGHKLKTRVKHAEQELNNLRTMPIEDKDTC